MRLRLSFPKGSLGALLLLMGALLLVAACSSRQKGSVDPTQPDATATVAPIAAASDPTSTASNRTAPGATSSSPSPDNATVAPPTTAPDTTHAATATPALAANIPTATPTGKPDAAGVTPAPTATSTPRPEKTPAVKPPADPLNKPYRPVREKLQTPEAGPHYRIALEMEGYEANLYAEKDDDWHLVASERAADMPGMFEKYAVLSPDNRTVVYVRNEDWSTNESSMWLVNIDGGNRRLLLNIDSEWWVAAPVWSPDSERIAYVRTTPHGKKPGLELWVVNRDGSGNHKLLTHHPSFNTTVFYGAEEHPLKWTAYGDLQYTDYKRRRVWTVDGETGELSYEKANIHAPRPEIPVVKTKAPIPIHSQNDPRWRDDTINSCGLPMGNFGCAINTVTMSFSALGVRVDPGQFNKELQDLACPIYWDYASQRLSENKLHFWGNWTFDWYSLDLALSKGRPAMVWLSDAWTTEDALLTHWVLVVGGKGQTPDGYRIYDPWDGTTYKTLGYYERKGYGLRRVYVYAPKPPKKARPIHTPNPGKTDKRGQKP